MVCVYVFVNVQCGGCKKDDEYDSQCVVIDGVIVFVIIVVYVGSGCGVGWLVGIDLVVFWSLLGVDVLGGVFGGDLLLVVLCDVVFGECCVVEYDY